MNTTATIHEVKPHSEGVGHHELFDTPGYRKFRAVVNWCVEYRKTTIVATLVVFFLGVYGFKFIEKQFFPDSSRPELMVEMWSLKDAGFDFRERIGDPRQRRGGRLRQGRDGSARGVAHPTDGRRLPNAA